MIIKQKIYKIVTKNIKKRKLNEENNKTPAKQCRKYI